jgi:lipoyl(octanoyl) transferase
LNKLINRRARFIDLGLIDFKSGWDYQTRLFEKALEVKSKNRGQTIQSPTENNVLLCEHPHVYTLGKSGKEGNLLMAVEKLSDIKAAFYHINRGGDITYHGPGQVVGYPILDLENFFTDIHQYMRLLEEAVIQTLAEFAVPAGRIPGLTGVWIDPAGKQPRKICALGVKTSRWVTMHGFALNVNPDLTYFGHIVPCGIQDKEVTSLEKETGEQVDINQVKLLLREKICDLFAMDLIT